jgi:hypothetical protein
MTTTVIEIISASLRLLNVIDEEETPSAEQGFKTLHILNDMLADARSDGIDLGWRPIADADISIDAPLKPQDVRGVKLWLAIETAPHFGIEPLPTVKELGNDAYAKLAKRAIKFTESDVSGLPIAECSDWTVQTASHG